MENFAKAFTKEDSKCSISIWQSGPLHQLRGKCRLSHNEVPLHNHQNDAIPWLTGASGRRMDSWWSASQSRRMDSWQEWGSVQEDGQLIEWGSVQSHWGVGRSITIGHARPWWASSLSSTLGNSHKNVPGWVRYNGPKLETLHVLYHLMWVKQSVVYS